MLTLALLETGTICGRAVLHGFISSLSTITSQVERLYQTFERATGDADLCALRALLIDLDIVARVHVMRTYIEEVVDGQAEGAVVRSSTLVAAKHLQHAVAQVHDELVALQEAVDSDAAASALSKWWYGRPLDAVGRGATLRQCAQTMNNRFELMMHTQRL